MIEYLLMENLPLYLLLASSILCVIRLLLGPTAPDRMLAVDSLGIVVVVMLALLGVTNGKSMLLDIAIAYSILAFIGTLAVSKYLEGEKLFE